MATPRFDDYLFIDFSAAGTRKTGKDSIWLAHGRWSARRLHVNELSNVATRRELETAVRARLAQLVTDGRRALIGFDFPYAYPEGTAGAFRVEDDPGRAWHCIWAALAERIEDDERNRSNRFEVASALNAACGRGVGPFWGCPVAKRTPHLQSTRTPAGACWRYVEARLRRAGKRPQESFKLLGAGSVGSQALLGIPILYRLFHDAALAPHSVVWPFEWSEELSRDRDRRPLILHAEIWPGAVELDASLHATRDAAQVLTLLQWAAKQDERGELNALLDQPLREVPAVRREEGWILGVG